MTHGRDEEGHVTLVAHSTGHDTDWVGLFREYGLWKGAEHTIENPMLPLMQLYHATEDAVIGTYNNLKDPVRLGAVSYIAADVCQTFAGGGNNDAVKQSKGLVETVKDYLGKYKNPKNFTQSAGGFLFLVQSLLFFKYAKTGTELSVDDLNRAYKGAKKEGKDIRDVDGWTNNLSNDKHRIVPKIIRDYPIQSGAVIQNTGMLMLVAHAFLEKKYKAGLLQNVAELSEHDAKYANRYVNKGGFYVDIYRTMASFGAWALLMYPIKSHPHKSDNPVEAAFQSFEENPQHVSSAIVGSASLAGMISGYHFKGNGVQTLGETLYLPGDYLLSKANNKKYGASDEAGQDVISKAVERFIASSPMILGESARRDFSCEIAKQLLKQSAHYELERAKPEAKEALEVKLKAAEEKVLDELCKGTLLEDPRYETMVAATRNLIVRFPEVQRAAAMESLVKEVTTAMPSVHVTPEELQKDLALENIAPTATHSKPIMHAQELGAEIKALANAIPELNAGESASRIFDAVNGIITQPQHQAAKAQVAASSVQHEQTLRSAESMQISASS